MAINTNGLTALSTNNTTWVSPIANERPVALANQIRGGFMMISGAAGDRLLDIPGIMLQDGMLVFLQTGYTETDGTARAADTIFQYSNDTARPASGVLANEVGMWAALAIGGGGAAGVTFRGTVDVANPATLPATTGGQNNNAVAVADAFTVETTVVAANVNANWDTVIDGWTTTDADIDSGDVLICTLGAAQGSPLDARYRLIRTGGVSTLQTVTNAGNTTTNNIVLNPNADLVLTGTDNAGTPVQRTITVSAPIGRANFTNYEAVLPGDQPRANEVLRVNAVAGGVATLEWGVGAGGATGGNTATQQDYVFQENAQVVRHDYTVGTTLAAQPGSGVTTVAGGGATNTSNAVTAGPITINDGVTVTIENGCNWIVL